jgi:crotonobetainyl-CoA:carnitine CoA-transferase CaiB-like acyl-CoA transferase
VASDQQPTRALDGIKILAFEQVLSGPFATCLLADMGAQVIKVERPGVGDVIRSWDSVVKGLSSGYVWLNRNKRSLTVDVKKEKGKEILRRLTRSSDIFFENYAPGVAKRLGLGYPELSAANPRLIYCSLSGYGQDGPYRDVKAYDLLIQGEGGIIATTGYPEKPAKAGIAIADIASGMYAVIGIMMALYQREKTGEGQFIDVSMLDSIVSWLGYFPHHYWHAGEEPGRAGMRHHYVTPYGPYLAADGEYVNLAVASPSDWELFCRVVIEKPELLHDTRFVSVQDRRKNRAALEEVIEAIFLQRDHKHWLAQLKKADMPHGIVRGIAQVLAHPQVIARKLIREAESPVGKVPVIANALKMSASPARYERIPGLGEDNDEILGELGYDDEAIADLRRDKVI